MKNIRVELKLTAIVHVSDAVNAFTCELGDPSAVTSVSLVRLSESTNRLPARDYAAANFAGLMHDTSRVLAERLRRDLLAKGF